MRFTLIVVLAVAAFAPRPAASQVSGAIVIRATVAVPVVIERYHPHRVIVRGWGHVLHHHRHAWVVRVQGHMGPAGARYGRGVRPGLVDVGAAVR